MVYVQCRQAGTLGTYALYAGYVTQSDRRAGEQVGTLTCLTIRPAHRITESDR